MAGIVTRCHILYYITGLSEAAIAGIVVGCLLLVGIVITIVVCCCCCRKNTSTVQVNWSLKTTKGNG